MVIDGPYGTPERRYKKRDNYSSEISGKEPQCYYGVIKYDSVINRPPNPELVPSVKIQKDQVIPLLEKHETLGEKEIFCLIEKRWFDNWKAHVNFDDPLSDTPGGDPPGPINNEILLVDPEEFKRNVLGGVSPLPLMKIKKNMMEDVNYKMVPDTVWDLLVGWYGGFHEGQAPTLARTTYAQNPSALTVQYGLDLYPLFIGCSVFDKRKHVNTEFRLPKSLTFDEVLDILRYEFRIQKRDKARLWLGFLGSPWKLIEGKDLNTSLDDFGLDLLETHQIIVEKKKLGESYPLEEYVPEEKNDRERSSYGTDVRSFQSTQRDSFRNRTSSSSLSSTYGSSSRRTRSYGSSSYDFYSNHGEGGSAVPGVCGLRNLGNTCFMNSALQCLTKTRCFRDYFIRGDYKREINRTNVLGMNGEVASSFGDLMELMWSGKNSVVSPRHFKSTIGKFNHTFAGYHQQDSHELVAFLLDGIHEDLNRVIKKPQTYVVEGKGRDNEVVASEAWEQHKKRNDSVIVDKFQGMLRSELVCPDCSNVSVTFDPYMYLSVPVPGKKFKKVNIAMIFFNNRRPMMSFSLQMPLSDGLTIKDVREKLSTMTGDVPPERIFLCEIFNGNIYSIYMDDKPLSDIRAHDKVFAYELAKNHEFLEPEERVLHPFCEARIRMRPETDDPFEDDEDAKERQEEQTRNERRYNLVNGYYDRSSSSSSSSRYYSRNSYCEEVFNFPLIVNGKNLETSGKEIYSQLFDVVKTYFKPDAREILLEKTKGRIDLDKPETIFPLPSDELREDMRKSLQETKKWILKRKKKAKKKEVEEDEEEGDSNRIPTMEESLAHTERVSSGGFKPPVPPRPAHGPMAIPEHVKDLPNGFEDNTNVNFDSEDDDDADERFSSADDEEEGKGKKMVDEDEEDEDVYSQDLRERGEYPLESVTSDSVLPDPISTKKREEEDGMKDEDEEEDEDDWEDPPLETMADRIMLGAKRENENSDIPNLNISEEREEEEEEEEEEDVMKDEGKKKKKKDLDDDLQPIEEDFEDPKTWKKYLFTVTIFSQAVKTNDNDPSSYEDNLYYDDLDVMMVRIPKKKSYFSYSKDKNYHTRVKVKLSDYLLKDVLDQTKLKKVDKHESVEAGSSKRKKTDLTLERCIEKFCERERLTKDNKWYCRTCKNHVQASKKFDIWKLPEVLVVQIKRFSTGGYGYRSKIDRYIHYPFELDMNEYTINRGNEFKKYRLYAVSNHFGGMGGGHYTAYAKAPSQSIEEDVGSYSWYNFDDSSASSMAEGGAQASSGYVLFYEAVNSSGGYNKVMKDEDDEDKDLMKKKKKRIVDEDDEEEEDVKDNRKMDMGEDGKVVDEEVHDVETENTLNHHNEEMDPLLGQRAGDYDSAPPQDIELDSDERRMDISRAGDDDDDESHSNI